MIELVIPEATPSLNKLLGQHWAHKHKARRRWGWLVRQARLNAKVFDPPRWPMARLVIERTGSRLLDHENCRMGTKFLTDALKQEGFIVDDSPEHIGQPVLRQIIDQHIRQTRVTIESVSEIAGIVKSPDQARVTLFAP